MSRSITLHPFANVRNRLGGRQLHVRLGSSTVPWLLADTPTEAEVVAAGGSTEQAELYSGDLRLQLAVDQAAGEVVLGTKAYFEGTLRDAALSCEDVAFAGLPVTLGPVSAQEVGGAIAAPVAIATTRFPSCRALFAGSGLGGNTDTSSTRDASWGVKSGAIADRVSSQLQVLLDQLEREHGPGMLILDWAFSGRSAVPSSAGLSAKIAEQISFMEAFAHPFLLPDRYYLFGATYHVWGPAVVTGTRVRSALRWRAAVGVGLWATLQDAKAECSATLTDQWTLYRTAGAVPGGRFSRPGSAEVAGSTYNPVRRPSVFYRQKAGPGGADPSVPPAFEGPTWIGELSAFDNAYSESDLSLGAFDARYETGLSLIAHPHPATEVGMRLPLAQFLAAPTVATGWNFVDAEHALVPSSYAMRFSKATTLAVLRATVQATPLEEAAKVARLAELATVESAAADVLGTLVATQGIRLAPSMDAALLNRLLIPGADAYGPAGAEIGGRSWSTVRSRYGRLSKMGLFVGAGWLEDAEGDIFSVLARPSLIPEAKWYELTAEPEAYRYVLADGRVYIKLRADNSSFFTLDLQFGANEATRKAYAALAAAIKVHVARGAKLEYSTSDLLAHALVSADTPVEIMKARTFLQNIGLEEIWYTKVHPRYLASTLDRLTPTSFSGPDASLTFMLDSMNELFGVLWRAGGHAIMGGKVVYQAIPDPDMAGLSDPLEDPQQEPEV